MTKEDEVVDQGNKPEENSTEVKAQNVAEAEKVADTESETISDKSESMESVAEEKAEIEKIAPQEEPPEPISASVEDEKSEEVTQNEPETENPQNESKVEKAEVDQKDDLEDEGEDGDENDATFDFTGHSEAELLDELKKYTTEGDFSKAHVVHQIKAAFDSQYSKKREKAYKKYVKETGEKEGFDFADSENSQNFRKLVDHYLTERKKHFKSREEQRLSNLEKKEALLEQLRTLVDDETPGASMKRLREIQDAWNTTGEVPSGQSGELWSNYRALLQMFYNKRNILFQLRDLDREKNLEAKLTLCEKAEALINSDSLNKALVELNELHEEYKSVGPVPEEKQEDTWQRFKTASDKLYDKKREAAEAFKVELDANLEKKKELITQVKEFTSFDSDRIDDWRSKTEEVIAIQKAWKAIGPVPNKVSKEVSRDFWNSGKDFFKNKSKFFERLEGDKEANLQKKEALCEKVESYVSEERELKDLIDDTKKAQRDWKDIGRVPKKANDAVYKRFKAACDAVFDKRREQQKERESEWVENLEKKKAIIQSLKDVKPGEVTADFFNEQLKAFEEIGFVPRENVTSIKKEFDEVGKAFIEGIKGAEDNEKETLLLKLDISSLKGNPKADDVVHAKRITLRKRMKEIENDMSTLRTNIEFFARSKNADSLRAETDKKIENLEKELSTIKKQVRVLNTI